MSRPGQVGNSNSRFRGSRRSGGLQSLLMIGAAVATVLTLAFGGTDTAATQPAGTPSVATAQGTPVPH